MPQISLYIDEVTLKKIEGAAARQHLSISKWVSEQIKSKVDPVYPNGYEKLFGSIHDDTFMAPKREGFSADSKREIF